MHKSYALYEGEELVCVTVYKIGAVPLINRRFNLKPIKEREDENEIQRRRANTSDDDEMGRQALREAAEIGDISSITGEYKRRIQL